MPILKVSGEEKKMKLSDRILELRRQKGISQEELADQLGVSRQAVSKWESEQSTPDIDKIILMSEYFGTTTDYLLKGIEPAAQNTREKKTGNAVSVMASYMVWIGLISSCVIWYENQNAFAVMNGFIWMIGGYTVLRIAAMNHLTQRDAMAGFFMSTLPAMSFFLLSVIYNILFYRIPAPYPLVSQPFYRLFVFAAVWLTANTAGFGYLKQAGGSER